MANRKQNPSPSPSSTQSDPENQREARLSRRVVKQPVLMATSALLFSLWTAWLIYLAIRLGN